MSDPITRDECQARHMSIAESLTHLRSAIDRIESRQWQVIIGIAATLALTMLDTALRISK